MTKREKEILKYIQEDPFIEQEELANRLGIARSSVAVHISHLLAKGIILGKGYVVRQDKFIAVAGGINIDIGGRCSETFRMRDSNPGNIRLTLGGVGRNIANNLTLLDKNVVFFGAVGNDMYGQQIKQSCRELKIDIRHLLTLDEEKTATYLYICDEEGEMQCALADTSICKHLNVDYFRPRLSLFQHAEALVIDGNIEEEGIKFLLENVKVPIFVDPVSVGKSLKYKNYLAHIHTLKPNKEEAELLSDVKIVDEKSLHLAAKTLYNKGVKNVCISLGSGGCYIYNKDFAEHIFPLKTSVVNVTGAGDAFMATLVWGYSQNKTLKESAYLASKAASLTVSCYENIYPLLSEESLEGEKNV